LLGWIDLTGLLPPARQQNAENVLNGIAYDTKTGRIFVTGKHWSRIFEIRLEGPQLNMPGTKI
jgi:glutamine cyclotransferase